MILRKTLRKTALFHKERKSAQKERNLAGGPMENASRFPQSRRLCRNSNNPERRAKQPNPFVRDVSGFRPRCLRYVQGAEGGWCARERTRAEG